MQINNNMNRFSAPQFGMALKVNEGAEKFLKDRSMEALEKLAKAGEEMKDFKFWDLEVGENGYRIKSKRYANAYKAPSLDRDRDPNQYKSFNDININAVYDGEIGPKGQRYPLTFVFKNNDAAVTAYNKYKTFVSDEDHYIELTKMLEANDVEKAAKEAEEKKAIDAKDNFISGLMGKFGNKKITI